MSGRARTGLARRLASTWAVAWIAAGCSVPLASENDATLNECAADEDCAGGACAELSSGRLCVAKSADLSGVLVEVRTAPDTSVSHLFEDGIEIQGSEPAGVIVHKDLEVPAMVTFSGRILGAMTGSRPCEAEDGSLPVTVELRSTTPYSALASTFSVDAEVDRDTSSWTFQTALPAGEYDLHVRPQACDGEMAAPAPHFVASVEIAVDSALELQLPVPEYLGGTLEIPQGEDVSGWTLELVEPRHGLTVSETVSISADMVSAGVVPIVGPNGAAEGLAYRWPGEPPIIRLRSADEKLAVHWELGAVDLDGDGRVALQLFDLDSEAQDLEATVVDPMGAPIAATVTLQSKLLTGSANKNASFRVRTETNAEGQFSVELVPGTYQVVAEPVANELFARVVTEWTVKSSDQCCGRTLQMSTKRALTGAVRSATGLALGNTAVVATPKSLGFLSYFETTVEPSKIEALSSLPRQAAGVTDLEGGFTLPVDLGTFDVFVRPEASTGFPWLVRPETQVQGGEGAKKPDLGLLTLPNPAILTGRISDVGGVASGALVRAWLRVQPADEKAGPRIVQIGEALADADGVYVLPLPPSIALAAPPSTP